MSEPSKAAAEAAANMLHAADEVWKLTHPDYTEYQACAIYRAAAEIVLALDRLEQTLSRIDDDVALIATAGDKP